jgi:hypothetical protein
MRISSRISDAKAPAEYRLCAADIMRARLRVAEKRPIGAAPRQRREARTRPVGEILAVASSSAAAGRIFDGVRPQRDVPRRVHNTTSLRCSPPRFTPILSCPSRCNMCQKSNLRSPRRWGQAYIGQRSILRAWAFAALIAPPGALAGWQIGSRLFQRGPKKLSCWPTRKIRVYDAGFRRKAAWLYAVTGAGGRC